MPFEEHLEYLQELELCKEDSHGPCVKMIGII
jgi:hypothetical protein